MDLYIILTDAIGAENARNAITSMIDEAERQREGRSAVRIMLVFFPLDQQREPEWGAAIDPDTPCRYNDIHGPNGSQNQ
jgi:hypothetical protein